MTKKALKKARRAKGSSIAQAKRLPTVVVQTDPGATGPAAILRPRREAIHAGRVVGTEVVSHPLDLLHHHGAIDKHQHAAGTRLRAAIEGSWPAQSVTARLMYVSDPGEHDEGDDLATDEEREEEQQRLHGEKLEARRVIGERCWTVTQHVCAGGAVTSPAALGVVLEGLASLARHWKPAKRC